MLERNPYYYAVMPNGDQLPYVDEIQINVVSDAEAGKLQVQQGAVDYCHGPFNQITLQRRPGPPGQRRASQDRGGLVGQRIGHRVDLLLQLRLHRRRPAQADPRAEVPAGRSRHAFNREAVQKSVYFNTGEPTTGTLSPKAIEYTVERHREAGLHQLARLLRRVRPGEGQGAAGRARASRTPTATACASCPTARSSRCASTSRPTPRWSTRPRTTS